MINPNVKVSINKADTTRLSELVFFSNTGDKDLVWRYDLASNNGSEAIELSAAPMSGNLTTCDIGNVTLTLDFTKTQARAEPYVVTFTMASSSFFVPSRALLVELQATVSALASAELCTAQLANADRLAVADTLAFTVTSIDAYGVRILDVAALTYSASIANEKLLEYNVPCTVSYDSNFDKHNGECILPTQTWGDFVLTVLTSGGGLVGDQTYNVSVTRCPEGYYWDGGSCVACALKEVTCRKGSTLETVLMNPTYWREDDSSPIGSVRHCTPRPENCLGTQNSTSEGSRQGCVEGATGPLCATCKTGWVQGSDLECTYCDRRKKNNGKIAFGLLLGACLVIAMLTATVGDKLGRWWLGGGDDAGQDGEDESEVTLCVVVALLISSSFGAIKDELSVYRDHAKVLFTYFQIISQQVGGCISAPWPSGYGAIISKLPLLSFNVPAFSASCVFPRTNFYSTLVFSTAGPIVVIIAILVYYLSRRNARGESHQLRAKAASYALALSYFVFPGGSLITFRLFALDYGFDDGQCFLKYDYSCSCAHQTYLYGWRLCGVFYV